MFPIRDTVPSQNPAIATKLIIGLNFLVFGIQLTMSPETLKQFIYLFGVVLHWLFLSRRRARRALHKDEFGWEGAWRWRYR